MERSYNTTLFNHTLQPLFPSESAKRKIFYRITVTLQANIVEIKRSHGVETCMRKIQI